jgi:hypothetical protein
MTDNINARTLPDAAGHAARSHRPTRNGSDTMASPKRADELEPGSRVAVDDTTVLTVGATRPGQHGDVDIRWAGSTLWASVPADREFTLAEDETA